MKMESFSKHPYGVPQSGPSTASTSLFDSAHYSANTIFVEFEDDTREMAVDVPDSFVAQTKTPPKYPPPQAHFSQTAGPHNRVYSVTLGVDDGRSASTNSSFSAMSNGHSPPPEGGPPPRDHLKIERDGRLINTMEAPPLPTPQQIQRIKKFSEEISKRQAEQERRQIQNELLRQSIRNSQKMRALKEGGDLSLASENTSRLDYSMKGKCNLAFSDEFMEGAPTVAKVVEVVERLSHDSGLLRLASGDVSTAHALNIISGLYRDLAFRRALAFAHKLESSVQSKFCAPVSSEAQDVTDDVMRFLQKLEGDSDADELRRLLDKPATEGLLYSHDKIAGLRLALDRGPSEEDALLERLSHYSEPNIKIVRIEKTNEPLGATVKNEGEAVVVGRIIRGGTAEASGLLHEGDEILEVNEVELRGKDVNEVCDTLANMQGTLTFLVVPTRRHLASPASGHPPKQPVMHVKAHVDYDPEDDPYVPCRELGISFQKGDILHVLNQTDANWWQAKREGEDESALPGLVPSAHFQQQREAMKHTIMAQDPGIGGKYGDAKHKTGFLCGKKSGRRKKRRKTSYLPEEEPDILDEIITYEEVALYYPRAERKRPVVLIGPPNIGRHELRQRLMLDQERFAAAIPHTSRPKRADEVDGRDYHFISRLQFEQGVLARRFVEHGEYEKSYYGTSLEAIRSVVSQEKICVLNLHPQSLKILKSSDLMPFVVFVAPPSLDKLKRWKMEHSEPINDDELRDIIERAREMEDTYGHYFDMIIVYSDPERAYQQLLTAINSLEREPQWVPAAWLANNNL